MLEAVWFKLGKEVAWVDPVINVSVTEGNPLQAVVDNGHYLYTSGDGVIPDDVDGFMVRIKEQVSNY